MLGNGIILYWLLRQILLLFFVNPFGVLHQWGAFAFNLHIKELYASPLHHKVIFTSKGVNDLINFRLRQFLGLIETKISSQIVHHALCCFHLPRPFQQFGSIHLVYVILQMERVNQRQTSFRQSLFTNIFQVGLVILCLTQFLIKTQFLILWTFPVLLNLANRKFGSDTVWSRSNTDGTRGWLLPQQGHHYLLLLLREILVFIYQIQDMPLLEIRDFFLQQIWNAERQGCNIQAYIHLWSLLAKQQEVMNLIQQPLL